jgi:prepilin-type N-terminal cleavage/methylation domain-containing protein/prepilin-type processing-associated H-X9-DG protein
MKRRVSTSAASAAARPSPHRPGGVAFTLIELLVVIAIIAILAGMLLPVLAGAKLRAQRLQCISQMKQLGIGFTLFVTDHSDQFPPTAYATGDYQYQLSWDDYIHRYIGGTAPNADLILGISGAVAVPSSIPRILKCPADRIQLGIDYATFAQRRTYAMNWAGPSFILGSRSAPLPPPDHGVGVYYNVRGESPGGLPDWEPRGYKTGAVRDSGGTILLAELPNGRNAAGNDWPSFCAGPGSGTPSGLSPDCVQLSKASTFNNVSYGTAAYGLHAKRFNYLFHDGHVATLKVTDTVGTGTTNAPKGMWTMTQGD